jgi:hypothetical protein
MSLISIDVESDAQSPAIGSMVCFGAVLVCNMTQTFYGKTRPITDKYTPESLAVSGFSREEHLSFDNPREVMTSFAQWLARVCTTGKPIFISDNPAFDWQWINYYFHMFYGSNPMGFSARRIGDLYCGLVRDAHKNWEWKKKFRTTRHTHNPVDDATGNAEAIIKMKSMGLKIDL